MEGQQTVQIDFKRRRNQIVQQIRRNKRRQIFADRRLNYFEVDEGYPVGEEQYIRNFQAKEDEVTNSFNANYMSILSNYVDIANTFNNYCENNEGELDYGLDDPLKYQDAQVISCNLSPRNWCEEIRKIQILDPANSELIEWYFFHQYSLNQSKYDTQYIPQALIDIQSQDVVSLISGLIVLRKIVCRSYEDTITVIYELTNHNLLEILTDLLKNQNKQVKLQSAWIICNIFAGDSDASEQLIEYGVFQKIIELLDSEESALINLAVWNIGNIMPNCQNQEIITFSGSLISKIIKVAQNTLSKNLFTECVWVVKNICVTLLENKISLMKSKIIQGICFLSNAIVVRFVNEQNYREVISFFINLHDDYRNVIVGPQIVEAVISKCLNCDESLYKVSIFFLSKIAQGDEKHTQLLLDHEILNIAHQFLLKRDLEKQITKQVLYMLSNIAAGCASQVQRLINNQQLLEVCAWILKQSIDDQLRIQSCYVFSQMSCLGNPAHVLNIYRKFHLFSSIFDILTENPQQGFIKALIHLLFLILDTSSRCCRDAPEEFIQRSELIEQENWIRMLLKIEEEFEGSLGELIHKLIQSFAQEIKHVVKYNFD